MVKRFVIGIGVFILAALSASADPFTPLLAGVLRNLGGYLRLPFHALLPQDVVDTVCGWIAQITPSMWLAVVHGLVALALVDILASLVTGLAIDNRPNRLCVGPERSPV